MQVNNTTNGATTQWEPPTPLKIEKLPPFPINSYPNVLREYSQALSESTQTPNCMASTRVLSVMALAVQGKFRVRFNRDYDEPLNLFCLTISPPASLKSAIDKACLEPVHEYVKQWNEDNKTIITLSIAQKKLLEKKVAAAEKEATNHVSKEPELFRLQEELANFEEIRPLRLVCDDVTSEALIRLMANNNGKMGLFSSEGNIFSTMMGLYSDRVNITPYLKAHAGDTIQTDRISRDGEFIYDPSLTLGISVQPKVLDEIREQRELVGRGLLARFLFSIAKINLADVNVEPDTIPPEIKERYMQLVFNLLEIPTPEVPHELKLSPDAYNEFIKYAKVHQLQLSEELLFMAEWARKMRGAVLRISGILHCIEHKGEAADKLIDSKVIKDAITISEFFTAHAMNVFDEIGTNKDVENALYVLGKIKEKRIEQFTKTELMRVCKRREFKTVKTLEKPLSVLVANGYVRVAERRKGNNNRPVEVYAVNPAVF